MFQFVGKRSLSVVYPVIDAGRRVVSAATTWEEPAMRNTLRRSLAACSILALSALAVTPAGATAAKPTKDPTVPFDYVIHATTTLKKLNQTVTIPAGEFKGTIDIVTSKLTGTISLPPAKSTVAIAGLPLATATFKTVEVGPVTGKVDFKKLTATATSVFNIQIPSVTPTGLSFVNLVGNSCTTSTPVSVTMTGSLKPPLKFTGTFTVPPLKTCGAATPALNLVIPGPGNTFSATATTKTK
jgi:hypothetical protein